jgi:hypothetical protein
MRRQIGDSRGQVKPALERDPTPKPFTERNRRHREKQEKLYKRRLLRPRGGQGFCSLSGAVERFIKKEKALKEEPIE